MILQGKSWDCPKHLLCKRGKPGPVVFQVTKWQDQGVSIVTLISHQPLLCSAISHLVLVVSSALHAAQMPDSVMPSPGQPTLPSPLST